MGVFAEAVAVRQALNDIALLWRFRIVGGSQHDAQRDATVPFSLNLVELAVDGVFEQFDEIGLEAHQDRLRFRVAHAAVEFQGLERAVLADHQAGVEEAGEGDAVSGHAAHGWQDDFAHRLGVDFRGDAGGR